VKIILIISKKIWATDNGKIARRQIKGMQILVLSEKRATRWLKGISDRGRYIYIYSRTKYMLSNPTDRLLDQRTKNTHEEELVVATCR
jgi:hypothetical protein